LEKETPPFAEGFPFILAETGNRRESAPRHVRSFEDMARSSPHGARDHLSAQAGESAFPGPQEGDRMSPTEGRFPVSASGQLSGEGLPEGRPRAGCSTADRRASMPASWPRALRPAPGSGRWIRWRAGKEQGANPSPGFTLSRHSAPVRCQNITNYVNKVPGLSFVAAWLARGQTGQAASRPA